MAATARRHERYCYKGSEAESATRIMNHKSERVQIIRQLHNACFNFLSLAYLSVLRTQVQEGVCLHIETGVTFWSLKSLRIWLRCQISAGGGITLKF